VTAADYFTKAERRGMRVGDLLVVRTGGTSFLANVDAISAAGHATIGVDRNLIVEYETVAALEAASVPPIVNAVRTQGSVAIGVGGTLYKRVVSQPSHSGKVQSADGTWWEVTSDRGVNVRTFRTSIDTDDTNSFTRALSYIAFVGGGTIHVPSERQSIVSAAVVLPATDATHITVQGEAGFNSRIKRATSYTGAIFSFNGAVTGNCTLVIKDLFFFSDYSTDTAPTVAAINLVGPSPQTILIDNCHFWDQYIAIRNNAVHNVWITKCRVHNSAGALTAATKFGGYAGILYEGHIAGNILSDTLIFGQAVSDIDQLTHGILLTGGDGLQVSNCGITAAYGVKIEGGHSVSIDDIYFANCIIDNCNFACVSIDGTNGASYVYVNIRFVGCHLDAGTGPVDPTSSVIIQGDCDNVQFIGCNIGLADRYNVYINGTNRWMVRRSNQSLSMDALQSTATSWMRPASPASTSTALAFRFWADTAAT
jgi:hypothetical protein